ncbi:hypothetical protein E0Z10_g9110 [Xylaria hypoxylon]|uniref:Uncharacterized protein n=1 Tax=Xylaria hypoxylon TaxID=37992 RepID=A0A4Z0YPY6_9PEZI|nr:hypothetical protein E0Z10_g9110 [Xylaria hypoxylon]
MSFHFVDQSDINGKERKLIRSHVMRGKNLGKKRAKRASRAKPTTEKSTMAGASSNEATLITTLGRTQCKNSVLAVARQFTNDLSLLYSTEGIITPQTKLHFHQLCFYILDVISPPEFCQPTGVIESIWFQLTFYNKASINIYDRLYGNPQKAMVHHNGLAGLIALRGGIRELAKRNFVIAEKAFRSDIELALHCGSNPKFSSEDVPRHLILINPKDCLEPDKHEEAEFVKSILYLSVRPELRKVVLDILRLSHVLDQASRAHKLDPAAYQTTLIYVSYRLLETKFPRHGSGADINFDILVQLAMTGFQNTFCFGIGRKLMTFPLVMGQFRLVARTVSDNNRSRQMVIFWALLMGRVSSLTQADDFWLIPKLKTLANELRLRTWPEVSNALRAFPWVKAAHEAQGEKLWNTTLAQALPLKVAELSHDIDETPC